VVGDDGSADARLAAALEAGDLAGACAALATARVFAGMTATSTAEHVTEHGLRAESSAEMALLLLEAQGVRALPLFLDPASLRRWRLEARPVALSGAEACRAALDEGAVAVVLDPGGAAVVLEEAEVRALGAGWVPVVGSALASRRQETELVPPQHPVPGSLLAAARRALAPERLRAARLLEGPDGLVLGVCPRRPLGPAALAALADRVMQRLGDDLPAEGLDLAQVPPRGPGIPLVSRSWFRRA
jgi:hypothetical protein